MRSTTKANSSELRNYAQACIDVRDAETALANARSRKFKFSGKLTDADIPAVVHIGDETVIINHAPDMGQPRQITFAKRVVE